MRKPKIEPFSWLAGLLSAYCTRQPMRFWPKIGEWGDTCGGRRWKKYHPRQITWHPGSPETAPDRRGWLLWLIHWHTPQSEKTAIYGHFCPALTAIYYMPYYTESQHISRKRGQRRGRKHWADTILRKVLYYTKYFQAEASAPDHPGRPRPEPGI